MENQKGQALRFDTDKVLHELIPAWAINELAKVYSMGAKKYAPHNWRKGMKWSRVIASLKRHLNKIELGEDFDEESKLYHAAHVVWNAITLLEYYKIYPQGDDRPHNYYSQLKIGLDIDDVLADFGPYFQKVTGVSLPNSWDMGEEGYNALIVLKEDKDFWLNVPVKTLPDDIPFEPHCYISSRSIPLEWTKEWLIKNKFPNSPLYCVDFGHSKVKCAQDSGIDIMVDDKFENFLELNKNGICCFLFDAFHNQRYNVGFKRIKSLKELI